MTRPLALRTGRASLCATAVLAFSTLAACGGNDNPGLVRGPSAPTRAPSATPAPPQYTATPVPFRLTQTRTFDILGWDSWPSAPRPTAVQFRWNAAIGKYELLAPEYPDWNRLEALAGPGDTPHDYDVVGSDGTRLPFRMVVSAGPDDRFVGDARIVDNSSALAYFAFGIETEPSDVSASGTMICSVGTDEIGTGSLTVDFAGRTVSGWVEPFWASVRYQLVQTDFAPGATAFAATFGTGGVLEGRFFGPRAVNIAVRAKGGGQGFAAISGVMTGVCTR